MWVAGESLRRHVLDTHPDLALVSFADSRDLVTIEILSDIVIRIVWVTACTLGPTSLDLVEQGNVLVELGESQERDKLAHDLFIEVSLDSEGALNELSAEDFTFLGRKFVAFGHLNLQWVFIGIVVEVDETIVKQEPGVALFTI